MAVQVYFRWVKNIQSPLLCSLIDIREKKTRLFALFSGKENRSVGNSFALVPQDNVRYNIVKGI